MSAKSISIEHVTRVEGHGNIHVCIEDGTLKEVFLEVVEPARLFSAMVKGRSYTEVSYIASRICGICSASHVVTSLRCIEDIFDCKVSERTQKLRELLVYGSYLQNHATHLFVFALPDYLNTGSVFPLSETNPELFAQALGLKALGNKLCTLVGGRSVHPICAVVGGFTQEITSGQYKELAQELDAAIPFALKTVDLFGNLEIYPLETKGDMLASVSDDDHYPIVDATRLCLLNSGLSFNPQYAYDHLEEYERDYSAALFVRTKQDWLAYMTTPLTRINASWSKLTSQAKLASATLGLRPPLKNPFLNNLAQALELVDALERTRDLCLDLAQMRGSSEPVAYQVAAGASIAHTEAPRGSLFHALSLDEEGRVLRARITTPTAQNLANLEADMVTLVEDLLAQGAQEAEIRAWVEKLVRAYDPCLSCSVH